jgi:glycopeptide antibiotics resistance protein
VAALLAIGSLVVAGVATCAAVAAARRDRNTRLCTGLQSVAIDVALVSSVVSILALTLNPITHRVTGGAHELQFVPIRDIVESLKVRDKRLMLEEASNILLFLPLGAALRLRGFAIGKSALIAFALSGTVEVAQLLFVSGRTTSVDDVLLNTAGAGLGYALLSLWVPPRGALAGS